MIKKRILKSCAFFILVAMLLTSLVCCDDGTVTKLSFTSALKYDYLKTLDGKKVSIRGYVATSSPVDGSFIFLMNLPYQSCPFCVPNTSQLSNTMEIYPKNGKKFEYTAQAIEVVGELCVSENEGEPFTDKYGYKFNFKIIDAEYKIITADELSEDMVLWQKVANEDIVSEVQNMYDYVYFLCAWNTYYVDNYTDKDGIYHTGYYLYANDAKNFIYNEKGQYNYGYKSGYFDSIINKFESIDKEAFSDIVANIRKAEQLANKALKELEDGNYTCEKKYVEKFDTEDYIYTINIEKELSAEYKTVYNEFVNWLGSWEL